MKTIISTVLALATVAGTRVAMAYEEPTYERVEKTQDYELRRYPAYVVAEMTVDADLTDAGGAAFGPLARYIGGANEDTRKIPMTAPVTQTKAGRRIPMTAPVTQVASDGGYVVQFIMPADFSLETTPKPTDPRIRLRTIPARVIAARRYSGLWTRSNLEENDQALREALKRDGIEITGPMEWARFDSPFRLWFMRRNEVWYPVDVDG